MNATQSQSTATPDARHCLSYAEFAARQGISIPTARRMVKRYGLRVHRYSATCVRIPLSEVQRFEAESLC